MRYAFLLSLALVMLLGACSTGGSPSSEEVDAEALQYKQFRTTNGSNQCLRPLSLERVSVYTGACDDQAYWSNFLGFMVHRTSWAGQRRCLTAVGNGNGAYLDYCDFSSRPLTQIWTFENNRLESYATSMSFSVR